MLARVDKRLTEPPFVLLEPSGSKRDNRIPICKPRESATSFPPRLRRPRSLTLVLKVGSRADSVHGGRKDGHVGHGGGCHRGDESERRKRVHHGESGV